MLHAQATKRIIVSSTLVLLAWGTTPACSREQPASETASTSAPTATAAARDDSAIATNVRARYYTDDTIRRHRIDVTAEDGVVTLKGTVDHESVEQHAVKLAQSVEGVVRVTDELTIGQTASADTPAQPGATPATGTAGRDARRRSPAWITTKIQSQYFLNSSIKPWAVDVTTSSDGVVTVEGTVDTDDKKAEALRIARGTEGVKNVVDRVTVRADANTGSRPAAGIIPNIDQPDPWITAKIQARYFVDDEIKARNINVNTLNGLVTLEGTVGSEAERRQAVAIARNTNGVESVVDKLRIQPSETGGTSSDDSASTTPQPMDVTSDAWTTTTIQAKYFLDASVKGHEINVTTRNGVVTLEGTVGNETQKTEAERIARETEGVTRVVNQLAAQPAQSQ